MLDNQHVSIIIPCHNEEEFIGKCLDSIVTNDYPKDLLEVLVVDGISDDGTTAVVREYIQRYPFIRLFDNPEKVTPVALNVGIEGSRGEIIMRMDAHATYREDYISKCVRYLHEYEADNVGGVIITLPTYNTLIGRAIVLALSHPFGVGNSTFRTGSNEPKWVDAAFAGCYRRELFHRIGYFNENLIRNQDLEFNLRIKKSGGKVLLHPEIVSYYYARSELKSLCRDSFRNGLWVIYSLRFTDHIAVSWRHLVPLAFAVSLAISALLSPFLQVFRWMLLFILGAYFLANVYFGIRISLKEKDFKYFFVMPIIFGALHISYGLGSIYGTIKLLGRKSAN